MGHEADPSGLKRTPAGIAAAGPVPPARPFGFAHVPSTRDRRRHCRSVLSAGTLAVCDLLLTGCGKQSILSPRSPQTHDIRTLWWWMLAGAGIVFMGAIAMLALAWP